MLTEDKYKGKVVVVLAGYDSDELMRVNQGLRSRFSTKITFSNFGVEECCTLLRYQLAK
jgi:hypothetical protein